MMILVGTGALLSSVRPAMIRGRFAGRQRAASWFNVAMRICAVVLAAGEGRRMGQPKALLPFPGTTFLGHLCAAFARCGVELTVAVVGAEAEKVVRDGRIPEGVRVAVNERWRSGMLSSILCGLDVAEAGAADAVLVHPVDNPLVAAATITAVSGALREGARIAVPTHAGRRGHPAGFARESWPFLRAADPRQGARAVLAAHAEWVHAVEAGADCLVDLDTPADLDAVRG